MFQRCIWIEISSSEASQARRDRKKRVLGYSLESYVRFYTLKSAVVYPPTLGSAAHILMLKLQDDFSLLQLHHIYTTIVSKVPKETVHACLWLAWVSHIAHPLEL